MEPEILGEVLETMIAETKEFRSEVVKKLRNELAGNGKEGLQDLFKEMDEDGNGMIDTEEFKHALGSEIVHIYCSMILWLVD